MLSDKTRRTYSFIILKTICFLIKIKYLKHTNKAQKLQIHVSQDQVKARDHLFQLYLHGADQQSLYPALHNLLVSILCHCTGNSKLACPTDYVLCLSSLKISEETSEETSEAWNFIKPSDITARFAWMQFCLRMIYFTHCYTQSHNNGKYSPPSPPTSSHHQEDPDLSSPKIPLDSNTVLLEAKEQQDIEGLLEIIDSGNNQISEYEGDIEIGEDDIEICDKEHDKKLLQ